MSLDVPNEDRSGLRADARRNRDRILHTAVHHFTSRGIGASLEDIARAAGVGAGTLYRHFPSREALLEAALREHQLSLLETSRKAREILDADSALGTWLTALQDYLRTFNGLPAPVLAAVKERASPLAFCCDTLVSITGDFLARAQSHGHARRTLTANELFLGALGIAWVLDRADAYGTTRRALEALFAHGYLDDGRARPASEKE